MENPEEVLQTLDEFTKLKPKEIPKELEDYLSYVAKTGDPVYQWSVVKCLFREKLLNVITDFYEGCPAVDLPPCPNVDTFNYEIMKNSLLERLESFASAPFTVQRLCELLTCPKKQYSRADKFMRAVEKNILVVSTREPGHVRRADSSQPELVNGVADTTGNEPSRVVLADSVVSSSETNTGSFLNTEGSGVQVIFEDSAVEKGHTKCYEDTYEEPLPRSRVASWKVSSFHSHVTRIDDEGDVDIGSQLTEKYEQIAGRDIMEEDEEDDDIDDEYIEPSQNVQRFIPRNTGPTPLDLDAVEEYCTPPSPEEEHSETSAAVSAIAEENSSSVSDTSTAEETEPSQVTEPSLSQLEPCEDGSSVSSESTSKSSDLETGDIDSLNVESTNLDANLLNCETVTLESTNIAPLTADAETAELVTKDSKIVNMETPESDIENVEVKNVGDEAVSSESAILEPTTSDLENTETALSSSDHESKSIEHIESEKVLPLETSDDISEESVVQIVEADSSAGVAICVASEDVEHSKPETIVPDMIILHELEPNPPEESSDIIVALDTVNEEAEFTAESTSDETVNPVNELNEDVKTVIENEVDIVPEPAIVLPDPVTIETSPVCTPEVAEESQGSVPSLEEERDREMMIQNERVESVIQENLEQIPVQEEILMQQIFVSRETPMDEKTCESEPEAMEVDETSQTVEEPMEQGDLSPTIS